jgi:hypothetical protein
MGSPHNASPRRNHDGTRSNDGPAHDGRATGGDAASADHTAAANNGACLGCAEESEPANKADCDESMLHNVFSTIPLMTNSDQIHGCSHFISIPSFARSSLNTTAIASMTFLSRLALQWRISSCSTSFARLTLAWCLRAKPLYQPLYQAVSASASS